jgi:signal transduction histidine kinase
VLPAVALLGTLAAVGLAMDRLLLAELDRSLMAQAAVESVSLFDRLSGPHLHAQESPLRERVSTISALYDADGALRVASPDRPDVPRRMLAPPNLAAPRLNTEEAQGHGHFRVLVMAVSGPDQRAWVLRLAVSLERHRATRIAFAKAAILVGLLVAAGLFGAQAFQVRLLHRRIEGLASHMRRLRSGDLDASPAADSTADVLGELRDLAADATSRLRLARDDQRRLVADAAHELRTPLAVLRTDIDVTLRRERTADDLRETLVRVREETDRLGTLARRLLDLASVRAEVREHQPLDVAALVRGAVEPWIASAAEKGLTLQIDLPEAVTARCDPSGVRQVIDNLLANALDFAPHGTAVEVRLRALPHHWRLQVRDHGPGVPKDQREAIFAPFHRLDRQREGSGLGLAIVREVVDQHAGRAWVEDAPGGGALLTVEFEIG